MAGVDCCRPKSWLERVEEDGGRAGATPDGGCRRANHMRAGGQTWAGVSAAPEFDCSLQNGTQRTYTPSPHARIPTSTPSPSPHRRGTMSYNERAAFQAEVAAVENWWKVPSLSRRGVMSQTDPHPLTHRTLASRRSSVPTPRRTSSPSAAPSPSSTPPTSSGRSSGRPLRATSRGENVERRAM